LKVQTFLFDRYTLHSATSVLSEIPIFECSSKSRLVGWKKNGFRVREKPGLETL